MAVEQGSRAQEVGVGGEQGDCDVVVAWGLGVEGVFPVGVLEDV